MRDVTACRQWFTEIFSGFVCLKSVLGRSQHYFSQVLTIFHIYECAAFDQYKASALTCLAQGHSEEKASFE